MNPNMFSQTDSRWRYKKYPKGKYTVGGSGCGLCAVTHVLMEQKKYWNCTPMTFWKFMKQYATCGHGTKWVGITNGLKHFGHKSVKEIACQNNKGNVYKEFNKGNRMAVALMVSGAGPDGTTRWTAGGHYIAFIDYKVDKNGKHWVFVKDSGGHHRRGWFCIEKTMGSRLKRIWIVQRLEPEKVVPPKPYKPAKIKVDGTWGKVTTKLTQYVVGAKVDGDRGPATIKGIQRLVGADPVDGKLGPKTVKKMQEFLNKKSNAGLKVDGDLGAKTIKAWQTWLNAQVK